MTPHPGAPEDPNAQIGEAMERAYVPYFLDPRAAERHAADILADHTPARRLVWGFWRRDRCTYAFHRGEHWPCRQVRWAMEQSQGNGTVYVTARTA